MANNKLTLCLRLAVFIGFAYSATARSIDSVVIAPYPNVDTLWYWHDTIKQSGDSVYLHYGYTQNCFCEIDFFQRRNQRFKDSFIYAEGYLRGKLKIGRWVYWPDLRGSCCSEGTYGEDSIVFYEKGRRVSSENHFAKYTYLANNGIEAIPTHTFPELNFKIICQDSSCSLSSNGILLKRFKREYLEDEIQEANDGTYNRQARAIMDSLQVKKMKPIKRGRK